MNFRMNGFQNEKEKRKGKFCRIIIDFKEI